MHWHYRELLPSLPCFMSLRLYSSLIFLNKGFIAHCGGGRELRSFKKQTKTNKGRGCQTFLYFFKVFFMTCKNFYCYCMYTSV